MSDAPRQPSHRLDDHDDAAARKDRRLAERRKVLQPPVAVRVLTVGWETALTALAVHVQRAWTHNSMNPVAVNMQCHSARRARATFTPKGVEYGF